MANPQAPRTLPEPANQLALFGGGLDPLHRRRRARGQCHDCSVDVVRTAEMYMLADDVWPLAPYAGFLCIGCLEQRLGRRLTPADFVNVPLNTTPGHSARLLDRLGPHPETPLFLAHSDGHDRRERTEPTRPPAPRRARTP